MDKARPYVRFTALNTVWSCLDKDSKSILDLGCGKCEPMRFINRNKLFYAVGLDIFKPYLNGLKKLHIHNDYILCDITKLPVRPRCVDVALCTEVLEHLERKPGRELLGSMEKIARKQVIVTSPVGEYEQLAYDGNRYQKHKWIWSPFELAHLGYRVIGVGFRNLSGESGLSARFNILKPFNELIWILAGPFSYFMPFMAGDMICVKKVMPE